MRSISLNEGPVEIVESKSSEERASSAEERVGRPTIGESHLIIVLIQLWIRCICTGGNLDKFFTKDPV